MAPSSTVQSVINVPWQTVKLPESNKLILNFVGVLAVQHRPPVIKRG